MTFPAYPEYKSSGVEWLGPVPGHWQVAPMKRFARLVYGDALPIESRNDGGSVPVFGSNGSFSTHDEANTQAPVIFVGRKGSCGALNWSDVPSFGIDTVYYIDSRVCGESLRWLYWALHVSDLTSASQDTGVPGLPRDFAHEAPLPRPPVGEQQAIATFLDRETGKIDALVAEQEKLIDLLKEKRQAVISHAVTKGLDPNVPMKDSGVEWLGEVPEHWEVVPLRRVVRRIEQGWSPSSEERFPDEGQWGVLKTSSVKGGRFDPTKVKALADSVQPDLRYAVREGDVLMIRGSGSPQLVGSAAYVNEEPPYTMLPDLLYRLVYADDKIDGGYLTYCLSSSPTRHQIELAARGIDILKIAQPSIAELRVAVPPLFEQRRIAEHLGETDSGTLELIGTATTAIDLLKERRSALISAAVTGKIDVRGLVAPEVTEAA